jgi:hypothetical protein
MATTEVVQNSAKVVKCGVVNSFQTVWHVKPGHEKLLREAIRQIQCWLGRADRHVY